MTPDAVYKGGRTSFYTATCLDRGFRSCLLAGRQVVRALVVNTAGRQICGANGGSTHGRVDVLGWRSSTLLMLNDAQPFVLPNVSTAESIDVLVEPCTNIEA